jgi:ubiquinone/menaquinone biosynthesis C-methylase UbiE
MIRCRPTFILILSFIACLLLTSFTCAQSQRDNWQQPERIMDSLQIQPGMVIGEAGAGEGYFTFKLSKRIGPNGKIYANDIDSEVLETLKNQIEKDSINNIIPLHGKTEDPCFPDSSLDMVIMVYVIHHLKKPVSFFENIKSDLKPGAAVVIVERDPEKHGGRDGHFLPIEEVQQILIESQYMVERIMTFLPRDNIYIAYPDVNQSE